MTFEVGSRQETLKEIERLAAKRVKLLIEGTPKPRLKIRLKLSTANQDQKAGFVEPTTIKRIMQRHVEQFLDSQVRKALEELKKEFPGVAFMFSFSGSPMNPPGGSPSELVVQAKADREQEKADSTENLERIEFLKTSQKVVFQDKYTTEDFKFYKARGKNLAELVSFIKNNAVRLINEKRREFYNEKKVSKEYQDSVSRKAGLTYSLYDINMKFAEGSKKVSDGVNRFEVLSRIHTVELAGGLVTILPDWVDAPAASSRQQKEWKRVMAAMRDHENVHKSHLLEAKKGISDFVRKINFGAHGFVVAPSEDQARKMVSEKLLDKVVSDLKKFFDVANEKGDAFDEATDSGKALNLGEKSTTVDLSE